MCSPRRDYTARTAAALRGGLGELARLRGQLGRPTNKAFV